MLGLAGIALIFVTVFGGYLASGGKMAIILKSLPYEFIIIGGAAIGSFVIGSDKGGIAHAAKDVSKVFKGPTWRPADYKDLLCLLYELIDVARKDVVALETHLDDPRESDIFARYPKILADNDAIELICDTLRSGLMNFDDANQVDEVLERRLEARVKEALHSSHALQSMADGLPALGIVAAVLGVIKTMGSIDQPPEILGGLIGGALVGTFLGVFLAYGLVGPFAIRIRDVVLNDSNYYKVIREVLVANLREHSANVCLEIGRQNIPGHLRPNFPEVDEAIRDLKRAAR
ncbi:flagellar motor stator protein MotA [Fluviibacterium sp. DFM31]|uniref:Flagellar motor stator protein MotA n=1 Tax=Meridianimarinicoccus marinus TaxID=3231483 RepID=A0ABV3L2X1_9RHOB